MMIGGLGKLDQKTLGTGADSASRKEIGILHDQVSPPRERVVLRWRSNGSDDEHYSYCAKKQEAGRRSNRKLPAAEK